MCDIIFPMVNIESESEAVEKEKANKKTWHMRMSTLTFVTAFFIFAISLMPSLISTKGLWIYYGDYNVQQIPFYMHVHEAIRSGNFLYDWGTDLGGSLLGCYSFYLLGSPFFWLTIPFKTEIVPYVMPWLSCLKYALMALFAYYYLKRHLKTENGAFFGALLFAFSGFQGAVLVYNHFHDAIAFFPLYLLLFEKLFEDETSKKRRALISVLFSLMTTLMLLINYYFFFGQVVFLIIYYFCLGRPRIKDILKAFFSGLAGICLAGAYILPAVYYTVGNSRLTDVLEGYDLLAYSEPTLLLGILKNVVMLPDVSGLNSMLNLSASRVSGIGAYIPLFSIAGVIAFFLYNKEKHFAKRVFVTSVVFAAFPILNSMFSAFNSEFYARWYYMPVLMMSLMTASVLENREETAPFLKRGAIWVGVVTLIITLMSVLPAKTEAGAWTVLGALKNYEQLISEIIFSFVMFFLLIIYIRFFMKKKDGVTRVFVVGACFLTTITMLLTGTFLVEKERKDDFVKQAIKGESPLSEKEGFFRFETDEDFYNYPLIWGGSHSISSFISTIPSSTLKFYDSQDIPRKVTSNPYVSRLGFRAITSAKYFLTNSMHSIEFIGRIEDMDDLKGYELAGFKNGFIIYENKNALPMGLVFEKCIDADEYKDSDSSTISKDRMLVNALILEPEDAEKYEKYVSKEDISTLVTITIPDFEEACAEKRESACTDFSASTHGFSARAELARPALVFFSVPYEAGFEAFVDGTPVDIVVSDFGFMSVPVESGKHEIEFVYSLTYFKYGILLSGIGLLIIFISLIPCVIDRRENKSEK